ncbi:MAG: hypothetical protein BWY88_00802 [Synergistetes bacterium ADurb.Bin520]|nr:MAG: hypothetical protein BWY88_00802 [Synergistetes bacterium ADurb.Bin520]
MAVMPLSRITSTKGCLLYTALARPGNPMWKNVESPKVAKIGREAGLPSARKAMAMPEATVMEPPMQTLVSTAFWAMARP